MAGNNRESEIKIELSPKDFDGILRTAAEVIRTVVQLNTFYDSENRDLGRGGWALRIRKENDLYSMTVKGKSAKGPDGVFVRREFEETVTGESVEVIEQGFHLGAVNLTPAQELFRRFGNLRVVPYIRFTNSRTFISALGYTLELDRTEIRDRMFYELELEVPLSKIQTARKKLNLWFIKNGWAYVPSGMSKLQRVLKADAEKKGRISRG